MLIYFFYHLGGAVPHQLRNILLRNAQQNTLACIMVTEGVKSKILIKIVPISKLCEAVADERGFLIAYSAVIGCVRYIKL